MGEGCVLRARVHKRVDFASARSIMPIFVLSRGRAEAGQGLARRRGVLRP